jgi:hypothetical protein
LPYKTGNCPCDTNFDDNANWRLTKLIDSERENQNIDPSKDYASWVDIQRILVRYLQGHMTPCTSDSCEMKSFVFSDGKYKASFGEI